jgi:hypothetical protein
VTRQQVAHAADHHLGLERLDQDAVATHGTRPNFVHRFEGPRQEQHGNMRQRRIRLDEGGDLVAVALGHPDVGEDDVRPIRLDALDRLTTVPHGQDLHVFVGKRQLDDALNGDAVIGEQQLWRH